MSVTITDLFCGAGGSSIGAELAGGTLRLGLNHWERAIETHAANFQHADHACEEISSLTTAQIRRYPDSDILLASPECTNHSLAKGARRRKPQAGSLFEDGPAGDKEQDRSRATMWDVVRFAEQKILKGKPYRAIVVENVVDAFKWGANDDGQLFAAWLTAVRALGYEHEIVWLNSMFCPPTPLSRDRMYVVFWQRGMRAPNLRVEPPSWCPACERIVDGQQTWKRPDRALWGRYGAQYFYACPACRGTVLPGVLPADSIIDYSLPAELIGERKRPLAKNTRERIRRGLERLAREPFAIRLTHSCARRPLTLPLVTLTLDRAMVVPPMGSVDARDAGMHPAPTQTTTTRAAVVQTSHAYKGHGALRVDHADEKPMRTLAADNDRALVMANRANDVPRPAGEAPTHPVLTGEHLAVVSVQRNGDVREVREPIGTVRAGGHHHAVVVRQNGTGDGATAGMTTPVHEPVRALTGAGHQAVVLPYAEGNHPTDAQRQPVASLTTHAKTAMVVPYDRTGHAAAAELEPTGTLTTRDRAAIVWTDEDIDACGFRMFQLHEIAGAMVMDRHVDGGVYDVKGNKRERMAQYGNAVSSTRPTSSCIAGGEVLG